MRFVFKSMKKQFGFRSVLLLLFASALIAKATSIWLQKSEEIDAEVTLPMSYYDPEFPAFDEFLRELEENGTTSYPNRLCIIPSKFRCYEIRKNSTAESLEVVYRIEMKWYDLKDSVENSEFLVACRYVKNVNKK